MLNVLLCPWKMCKRFQINNQIYDSILVLFVSGALYLMGIVMRLAGIVGAIYWLNIIKKSGFDADVIIIFLSVLISMLLGSIFILAGRKFSQEVDSNKIYAYSASIIALISCVIGVIALIVSIIGR